jgi:hypothetical protein
VIEKNNSERDTQNEKRERLQLIQKFHQ